MKYLVENKHWDINKEYNKEKLLYLLIDRPTQITYIGSFTWLNNKNQFNREYDLPAIVLNLEITWLKNNKLHRDNNKPAVIECNGTKEYWLNDKRIKVERLK